uniref:SHSP domain-containing protein n=1 Tax=Eptatretus burgeri TaxID=7764 RepID=A0A8C4X1H3_EPTBU
MKVKVSSDFGSFTRRVLLADLEHPVEILWRHITHRAGGGKEGFVADAGSYYVTIPVRSFRPEDIVVTTFNHQVAVAADGSVSNRLNHLWTLPADADPCTVTSSLGADGLLTLSVRSHTTQHPVYIFRSEIEPRLNDTRLS